MKKEQNTTMIPPASTGDAQIKKAEADKPAAEDSAPGTTAEKKIASKATAKQTDKPSPRHAGISLPHTAAPKTAAASAVKKKKAPAPVHTPHPEDETLEEVLDDAIPSEDVIEEIPMEEPEEMPVVTKRLSLFQRRQQQKQEQAEEKMSAIEVICRRSGLTEDDVMMLFELGYENELGRLVGYENLKRLKSEHLKRVKVYDSNHYTTAFGYRGEEFVSNQNRNSVRAAYLHDRKQVIARLLFSALLSILLLFLDLPHLLGETLIGLEANMPLLLPIFATALFLIDALISKRQIFAGLRSILHFRPTPYSICALLPPLVLLYDLASLFAGSVMLPINFLFSLSFLVTALCDILRLSGELRVLQLLSAEGAKVVLSAEEPYKKKLRRGNKIVKIVSDDIGDTLYRVRRSNHTVGFFRRSNAMHTAVKPLTVLIIFMLASSVMLSIGVAVATSSLSATLSAFMAILAVTLPVSSLFTFFYPLSRANRLLTKRNCALVGEGSVEEYADKKTVVFRDTDLFAAEKHTVLSVREGNDYRTDLRLSSILFRRLGGTLSEIGEPASSMRQDPPVSIVRIQESGVEAMIDNKYHILLGSAAFLSHSGIRVPAESTDAALRRADNVALMYVAIDGVLKLSYEIEYQTDASFEEMLRELSDRDAAVAINTYDPNLNEAFLQKCRPDAADTILAVKPGRLESNDNVEITDTGAVALGKESDIVYPLYAAHSIKEVRRFGFRIQLIASLIGAGTILMLHILGLRDLISVASIALYQLFWSAVSLIATCFEVNKEKLHLD